MRRRRPPAATLLEAALDGSLEEYRRSALQSLADEVGFDIGLGWSLGSAELRPAFAGFDGALWTRFLANAAVYQPELAPVVRQALDRGVAIDNHVYGPDRHRLAIVRDIIQPLGLLNGITVGITWRGAELALFRIGRVSRREFHSRELARAQRLVPVLRATEVLRKAVRDIPAQAGRLELTRRESALLELFATGSSYEAAAAELGITLNTVRTHVRHLYAKLGASSKTDAVRRGLSPRWRELPPR